MSKPSKLPPTERPKCGTAAGATAHYKNNETLCEPCRLAKNKHTQQTKAARQPRATTSSDKCGTLQGANRHRYWKEEPCEPCRLAFNAFYMEYHRDYNKRNPHKQAEWNANKDPEKVKEWNAKGKANYYAKLGPEAVRQYFREYNAQNPEVQRRGQAKWRASEAGKEQSRKTSRKRRALKKATNHAPYTEQEVLDRWGSNCHICGEPIDFNAPRSQAKGLPGWERGLHFDHVVPLAKGGDDNIDNVKPAHAKCNLKKWTALPE
jgi:5-methylcytosine-specific restriction endonuclease McrA